MCGGFLGDVFRIGTAVASVAVAAVTLNPFAIVAAVGAVANVVGYYTHSKELQIAGGVLGAVGAIGGLANAAGLFSLSDIGLDAASTGLSWGSEAASGASSFGASGAGELGLPGAGAGAAAASAAGPVTVDTMPDVVSIAGGVASPEMSWPTGMPSNVAASANAPAIMPEAAVNTNVAEGLTPSVGGGMINTPAPTFTASGSDTAQLQSFGQATVGAEAPAGAPGTMINASATPVDPTAGVSGAVAPSANPADVAAGTTAAETASPFGGNATGVASAKSAADPTVWDKIWKFVDTNSGGRILSGALMAGGAFLSGATNAKTPAEIEALKAQAEANKAAANISRQQLQNMQGTLPTAYRRSDLPQAPAVTGSVAPPPPPGLINTAPKLAPVTGVPA